jgi:hypothetical protein
MVATAMGFPQSPLGWGKTVESVPAFSSRCKVTTCRRQERILNDDSVQLPSTNMCDVLSADMAGNVPGVGLQEWDEAKSLARNVNAVAKDSSRSAVAVYGISSLQE